MAADKKCMAFVIELEDTPTQPIDSLIRKRCLEYSSCSNPNSKRRRICCNNGYKSPLKHLEKIKLGNERSSANLDDSVIVIEDRTGCSESGNRSLLNKKKNQSIGLDNSVIILSDDDDEDERNTVGDSELAVISAVKNGNKRNNANALSNLVRRGKNNANVVKLPVKTRSISKQCSESNLLELQTIAVDSEDENTIPNDVSSKSKSEVETIIVDYSPRNKRNNQASSRIHRAAVDSVNKNSHATGSQVPRDGTSAASESPGISSRVILSVPLYPRTKRNSPSHAETEAKMKNSCSLQTKSLKKSRKKKRNVTSQSCNWKSFVEAKSNETSVTADSVTSSDIVTDQNGIGSYYTKEIINKKPGSLRDIIIDGSNVAMAYTNGNSFSEDGLKLVIDYFTLRGHTVKVFIPQHKRSFKYPLLEVLHTRGIVVFTPSRKIGGKQISSYDDRFILDYATMCDGIVVSLDQYRDLYAEKQKWRHTIENRLLMPTFVGKCVMFPEDPLGKTGPKLDEFLRH